MEQLLKFLQSMSVFQVVSSLGILALCTVAFFGKFKKIKIQNA